MFIQSIYLWIVKNSYLTRTDFSKSDFVNGCEIRIIVGGLAVEYFSLLYFSTIFSSAQLFCNRSKVLRAYMISLLRELIAILSDIMWKEIEKR